MSDSIVERARNAAKARLFIRSYLIERDQALGHPPDEDEIDESAREIFDGVSAALEEGKQ